MTTHNFFLAGDLLRAEQERPGSQYGELIKTYIKEGKIVPMEVTIALLENEMLASGQDRFLIDGFPRKMDQALKFEEAVSVLECLQGTSTRSIISNGQYGIKRAHTPNSLLSH